MSVERRERAGHVAPGPGRRVRLSADQRRQQLVSAAVDVLADAGYQATTAEAIARRAGVSKGLLWYHFADLDDLLEQTARATLMSLAAVVGARIDLTAPTDQVVREAVRAAAGLLDTHGAQRAALREIVVNLRHPDGTPRLGPRDYEELYAAQEQIFRRGQQDGDIDAVYDPRVLAVTYQGAVDAMLSYLDDHPEADRERYAAMVSDVLLHGLASRGERA